MKLQTISKLKTPAKILLLNQSSPLLNANHGWVSTAAASSTAATGLMTQQKHGLHAGYGGTGLTLSVCGTWDISLMHPLS